MSGVHLPRRSAVVVCALGAAYLAAYAVLSLMHLLHPFGLFNVLLTVIVLVVCARSAWGHGDNLFAAGTVILTAGNVLVGQRFAADALGSGAMLLCGLLSLYVGLRLEAGPGLRHLGLFIAGYLALFWLFAVRLPNATPLLILGLLGLCATARSFRLTAFFWAMVLSFTFCQPYAWECLLGSFLLLTALFGARGPARSPATLIFLGGGLAVLLALLFPIVTLVIGQDYHSVGLLLRDARVRAALILTATSAAVATLLLLLTITPLAYAISRLHFPGRTLLLALIDLPIVIPQSAAGIALLCVLGRRQIIGGALADLFGVHFDGTVLGILAAQMFVAMPFMARSALAAFDAADEELEAVAGALGASPGRVFVRVALPLASRTLAAGAVLAFARAAGEFGALLFLAPTPETAPMAVFNRFNSVGMGEAVPLVALLLLLSLGTFFLLQLATRLLPAPAPRTDSRRTSSGRGGAS
jgi:molybdate/tungstate transport system permease protein